MPEAMGRFEQSDCSGTESFARRFRLAVRKKKPVLATPHEVQEEEEQT